MFYSYDISRTSNLEEQEKSKEKIEKDLLKAKKSIIKGANNFTIKTNKKVLKK